MAYYDGFLLPCPTDARARYVEIARIAADVFRRNGATEVVEAWGDDVPEGTLTSMPLAVKREADESVVFSWIAWPDKATRDAGMAAAMEDDAFKEMTGNVPFDGKRMMYGGFVPVLDIPGARPVTTGDYVDGFVAAVPTANREAFVAHATTACTAFVGHGALRCVETWGDEVPDGVNTSFPMAVAKTADETVVFSFVVWADKAARDAGWAKIMADPALQPDAMPMPFDGKRMIYGGFVPVLTTADVAG